MSNKLTKIELFLFDTKPTFYYDFNKANHPYILLRLSCAERSGCGICQIQPSGNTIDLISWGAFLKCITASTLDEALNIVQQKGKQWSVEKQSLLSHALLNITEVSSQTYLKEAIGSTGEESLLLNRVAAAQQLSSIDLSELIKESSSYYSIFVRPS